MTSEERQAIKDAKAAAEAQKKMAKAVGDLIVNLQSRTLSKASGLAGAAVGLPAMPAGTLDSLTKPLTQAFTGILDKINSVAGSIASLVEKMNPATVQFFQFALDDLMAVFGEILQPILEAITVLTRKLADTFLKLKPVIDPIIEAVVKMIGVLIKMIEPLARAAVPVLQLIGAILENVFVPAMEKMLWIIDKVAKGVIWVTNQIIKAYNFLVDTQVGRALGFKPIQALSYDDLKDQTSVGKAIRGVNRMSAADIGAKTREAAFGQVAWRQQVIQKMDDLKKLWEMFVPGFDKMAAAMEKQNDILTQQMGQQMVA